jgi:N-acetylglucosaminyl-diphospho-decaprenol L-rhamnosyltransferase
VPHASGSEPVTVVIVHWNQPDRLVRTLERLDHQGVAVRPMVVDNGSEPRALAALRERVGACSTATEVVELGSNTGFGPAANVGLRRWLASGEGEWVALVPHDALPDDKTLLRLVEAGEGRPRAGLLCADVGDAELPVFDPYFGGMTVPGGTDEGWQPVDYPHGTLLMARRSCLEQVGLFDERYFAYCEETDLGLRARSQAWEVGLVRGVGVTNPSMRSGSPAVDYLMHRNTLLLVREHSGRYHAFVRFCIAGLQLGRALMWPRTRPPLFSAKGRLLGLRDFLRRRYGPPPSALFAEAGEPAASDVAPTPEM